MTILKLNGQSDLRIRAASGIAMVAVALTCLWVGSWLFAILLLGIAVLMAIEWNALVRNLGSDLKVLGIAYILFPIGGMLVLRHGPHGFGLALWTLAIVWATDIFAYFSGRYFGGPKLAPSISPSKTWSGLAGGVVAAGVIGPIVASQTNLPMACYLLGAPLGLLSQGGDLFESWVKRQAGVKDSGSIIPGHGGVLDRLDGLVPVATAMGLLRVLGLL
ncbi:MAG: phosphatidate cytidylyltransferase [Sphingomonadaceae bacterium]